MSPNPLEPAAENRISACEDSRCIAAAWLLGTRATWGSRRTVAMEKAQLLGLRGIGAWERKGLLLCAIPVRTAAFPFRMGSSMGSRLSAAITGGSSTVTPGSAWRFLPLRRNKEESAKWTAFTPAATLAKSTMASSGSSCLSRCRRARDLRARRSRRSLRRVCDI